MFESEPATEFQGRTPNSEGTRIRGASLEFHDREFGRSQLLVAQKRSCRRSPEQPHVSVRCRADYFGAEEFLYVKLHGFRLDGSIRSFRALAGDSCGSAIFGKSP